MKQLLFALLLVLAQNISAETGGWITRDGKPVPNTDAMKSINGFGGWLVVTPDADWEKKWNTPPETTPHFTEAKEVKYGEVLTILPFFINPKLDSRGEIRLLCDIRVVRPDGGKSVDAKDLDCASGKLRGNPRNVRLTSTVIKYIGEESDPLGTWVVEVNIKDTIRNVIVPLKSQFVLQKKANNTTQPTPKSGAAGF